MVGVIGFFHTSIEVGWPVVTIGIVLISLVLCLSSLVGSISLLWGVMVLILLGRVRCGLRLPARSKIAIWLFSVAVF